jgi:hypothetical protein
MWNWLKRQTLIARHAASGTPAAEPRMRIAPRRAARVPTRYAPLHDYLENRFADSVVLTFGQLEDLIGGALPDIARVQYEWWTSTDGDAAKSSCSDAWILAGRTATPNLMARTVTFERQSESPRDSRSVK